MPNSIWSLASSPGGRFSGVGGRRLGPAIAARYSRIISGGGMYGIRRPSRTSSASAPQQGEPFILPFISGTLPVHGGVTSRSFLLGLRSRTPGGRELAALVAYHSRNSSWGGIKLNAPPGGPPRAASGPKKEPPGCIQGGGRNGMPGRQGWLLLSPGGGNIAQPGIPGGGIIMGASCWAADATGMEGQGGPPASAMGGPMAIGEGKSFGHPEGRLAIGMLPSRRGLGWPRCGISGGKPKPPTAGGCCGPFSRLFLGSGGGSAGRPSSKALIEAFRDATMLFRDSTSILASST
mmetsp:Transcript_15484/g.36793  ORF Transcript_15484/g.36793 Transcript_15484/m.36793 type:complete len:292 (-) Transcript_15484:1071-1946(-)